METNALLEILSRGEDSQHQFNANFTHADEVPAAGLTIADIDMDYFGSFFERVYGESLDTQLMPLEKIIDNLNLGKNGSLNLAGALLFAQHPHVRLPVFIIKAMCFPGTVVTDESYLDSREITGKIGDLFQHMMGFVYANIRHVQKEQNVNSIGIPEIPRIALEEILVNALIHRDYFISAPIRIFVFADRVEVISPGHLPNNLTIENIKAGNSNIRNPILASFAARLLPYRGIGSGIRRAIQAFPHIQFDDDPVGNNFTVVFPRGM